MSDDDSHATIRFTHDEVSYNVHATGWKAFALMVLFLVVLSLPCLFLAVMLLI